MAVMAIEPICNSMFQPANSPSDPKTNRMHWWYKLNRHRLDVMENWKLGICDRWRLPKFDVLATWKPSRRYAFSRSLQQNSMHKHYQKRVPHQRTITSVVHSVHRQFAVLVCLVEQHCHVVENFTRSRIPATTPASFYVTCPANISWNMNLQFN